MIQANQISFEKIVENLPEPILIVRLLDRNQALFHCSYSNQAFQQLSTPSPLCDYLTCPTTAVNCNTEWLRQLSPFLMRVLTTGHPERIERKPEFQFMEPFQGVTLELTKAGEDQICIRFEQATMGQNDSSMAGKLLQHNEKATGVCTWLVDGITGHTTFSASYLAVHCFSEEDITNENATELAISRIHPDDAGKMELFRTQIHPQYPASESYRYMIGPDSFIWLKDTISAVSEDGTQVGITQDITEARNREIALQKALSMKQKILYTSPGVIYVYDIVDRKNLFANQSLTEKLGYTEEEIQKMGNQFLMQTVHPDDLQKVIDHHTKHLPDLRDDEVIRLQYRMMNQRTGEYVWLESTESIFERTETGEVHTIIGIASNKTAEMKAEIRLRQTNEELEQLVYSVSHDLRSPVRHIASYGELIRKNDGDRLSQNSLIWLENVVNSASRLGGMIDELLDFSISRKIVPCPKWICSESIIKEILESYQRNLPGQTITWTMDPLPRCYVDPDMFSRIWENLISNAVKYSSLKPETRISIQAHLECEHVIFSIHDNGCGFDEQYSDKLFKVFHRLHEDADFEGHGIGLANADRMVSMHGGKIWAKGRPGEGASFYFSMPPNLVDLQHIDLPNLEGVQPKATETSS